MARFHSHSVVLLFAVLVSAARGAPEGQATTSADVGHWLVEERARAIQYPKLNNIRIEFSETLIEPVSPRAEIEAMARATAQLPDHPDRARVERWRRQSTPGHSITKRVLWTLGPGQWRLSSDFPERDIPSIDEVWTPSSCWVATPQQISLIHPDRLPADQQMQPLENTFLRSVGMLLNAGLGFFRHAEMTLRDVRAVGDQWSAEVSLGPGLRVLYEGNWSDGRGIITRARFTRAEASPPSTYLEEMWTLADHRALDATGEVWSAGRASRAVEGITNLMLTLESTAPFTDEEFAALTAYPDQSPRDPWRGEHRFTQILDRRNDPSRPRVIMNGVEMPLASTGASTGHGTTSSTWAMWLSIVGVALLVCAGIVSYKRVSTTHQQQRNQP